MGEIELGLRADKSVSRSGWRFDLYVLSTGELYHTEYGNFEYDRYIIRGEITRNGYFSDGYYVLHAINNEGVEYSVTFKVYPYNY